MMTIDEGKVAAAEAARNDEELARAAGCGSRAALAELFRRHRSAVYGVAYRITGSTQDAEDVLQDVFLGLRRALARYEERGRFDAWIRGVAARVARMKVRSRSRETWDRLPSDLASAVPSPALAVDRLAVQEALAAMPESLRTVFLLREVDGYPHVEIAHLLEIRPAACRVRLHRAWKFLEDWLGGAG